MPWAARRSALALELATVPSILPLMPARQSMKWFAVEPVPSAGFDVFEGRFGDHFFHFILCHAGTPCWSMALMIPAPLADVMRTVRP